MSPVLDTKNIKNPCVSCGSSDFSSLFEAFSFDSRSESFFLIECSQCGLVRIHPFLNPQALQPYYNPRYYGSNQEKFNPLLETLVRLGNKMRAKTLLNTLFPKDAEPFRVLDIGCGRGNFLKELSKTNTSCVGIDIPTFQLPASTPRLEFRSGDLLEQSFSSHSFDGVSIWHVLEHVQDPAATVKEISRILKPGGVLAVAVPGFDSIQSKLFGRFWFHLDLPRHLFHFKKEVLLDLLRKNGLKPFRVKTASLEQNIFGFVQSTLNFIFHTKTPNRFFSLLKKNAPNSESIFSKIELGIYCILTLGLLPFALLEHLVSTSVGRGGMFMIYARKSK